MSNDNRKKKAVANHSFYIGSSFHCIYVGKERYRSDICHYVRRADRSAYCYHDCSVIVKNCGICRCNTAYKMDCR